MKKILMTLVAAVIAVSASAQQVYVGGTLGIGVSKVKGGDEVTTYKVLPEVGYSFNDDWAIGTVLGWGKGNPVSVDDAKTTQAHFFTVSPYVRYTFLHSKYVDVFVDTGLDYLRYQGGNNELGVGVKPGVAINLNRHFTFLAKVGFAGWKNERGTYTDAWGNEAKLNNQAWGASFDGNNLSFGVYYNF